MLLIVAPLVASAGTCAKCGVVAPTGWKLCQRCKNEQEKLERAEARKKRKAEEDEARRKKEEEERATKLKKLVEAKPSSETSAAAPTTVPASEAKPIAEVCPGLFGIRFGQTPDATFQKKAVVEDGRSIDRHFFTPAKQFRGFNEYSVRASSGGVYEIATHRRYVKGSGLDAKQAANAEFNDCVALLEKKFGRAMTSVEESLSARVSQLHFAAADGIVSRTITIRLVRDLNTAIDNRYDDNSDSLMAEMDRVFDLWIVATDNIELLREQHVQEASDLDAL